MGKKGFYFDMTACIGCRTCQVACKDKNDLKPGINFRQVRTFETGVYPDAKIFHYSSTCNHCKDPKCVKGCPTGAMHIAADGTVQHDADKCIGCQYCVWNCPYGVPQYMEEEGKVSKCNMCKDLTDKGQNPACVDACIMRALEWGDLDELKKKHPDAVSDLPILASSKITHPSVLVEPKACALNKGAVQKEV
ncbi:4Fe-4S dicluster domain-containing protein [Bacillus massiliigorillae]|uniref:4Fe-4S dicluster domain-containing protein n=1 Tax=Bacillus massiliigorillae TaxID=1243664 RepID=UPI00039AD16A|nr:4Fe-4S dicluster domain-containing protein [Bacillus massiliigorillae]